MIRFFSNSKPLSLDLGLLFFRVVVGLMMLPHGWPKLANFTERMEKFSDPLGIGTTASLAGAVFAEFFCSLFLVLGLFTRAALVPLIFTFVVITFVVHGADPVGDKETPLLFLVSYIVLFLTGPGRFSVDARLK
ncbi:MAG: DoxX family protein [Bacteroidota bacterium]